MSTDVRLSVPWLPLALLAGTSLAAVPARAQTITCVSVSVDGAFADDDCNYPWLSTDGRWLSFVTRATNLVPGGTFVYQVYLYDVVAGTLELVSVDAAGLPGNAESYGTISRDGNHVFLSSRATNFVPGDTNARRDVFVRDRATGSIERISLATSGAQGDADSYVGPHPMTADGRFFVFSSEARNFAPGDLFGTGDVFVRDRWLGTTERLSISPTGAQPDGQSGNEGITPDGRYVWFTSTSSNLVRGDTNGVADVFLIDRANDKLSLVSRSPFGVIGDDLSSNGTLSDDARFLVFTSRATNFIKGDTGGYDDVFVRDMFSGSLRRVTQSSGGVGANFDSYTPVASPDGRFVCHSSLASNLVPDDFNVWDDVFVFDTLSAGTTMASRTWQGASADDFCVSPTISGDGRLVAFESGAKNLLAGFVPVMRQIYLVDRGAARVATFCPPQPTSLGCVPAISATGTPSMSAATPFEIRAAPMVSNKTGILFYGMQPKSKPFHGGTLCVAQPFVRTPVQSSGGNPPPDDCSGAFALDFNAALQAGVDPRIGAGVEVFCQYWFRDPAAPSHVGLSDALQFVVQD